MYAHTCFCILGWGKMRIHSCTYLVFCARSGCYTFTHSISLAQPLPGGRGGGEVRQKMDGPDRGDLYTTKILHNSTFDLETVISTACTLSLFTTASISKWGTIRTYFLQLKFNSKPQIAEVSFASTLPKTPKNHFGTVLIDAICH